MCKFCDNNKSKKILSYDNANSMNILYGQYQGVNIYASLSMKENMLLLEGSGSYRSKSDCYYDDELDCDSEYANNSNESYVKISYCPFCGKKIESTLYERTYLKDKIAELKEKIKKQKTRIIEHHIVCQFSFDKNESSKYEDNLNITEILNNFNNVNCEILSRAPYGTIYNDCWPMDDYKSFTLNTPIKIHWSSRNRLYSENFLLDDIKYNELKNLGLVKTNNKLTGIFRKEFDRMTKELEEMKKELSEAKKELKSYENDTIK